MYSAEVANKELKDGSKALYSHDLLACSQSPASRKAYGRIGKITTAQGLEGKMKLW
jgi:hypothetical protein